MLKKIIVTAMAFMMFGCVGLKYNLEDTGAPPVPPPPPKGTEAELTAGTETASRVWAPATLATQFAGAAAEVVDEAVTAANMNGDVAHAPSQNALIDYLMATIDPDGDGSIADSALSLYGLTITGSDGLHVGVAATTKGTVRWYDNTAENQFHCDIYASNFTQNWGIALQPAYPTVANSLFTVTTNGVASWTDPATFTPVSLFDANTMLYATADNTPAALTLAEQTIPGRLTGGNITALTLGTAPGNVAQWQTDPGQDTLYGFDNTTNTYHPVIIGANLAYDQPSNTLSSTGGFTGGTLTSELVIDETGIEGQPTDAISDCSSFAATGGGIFYDDSEGKWKKCQDNTLSDLDTNTGSATPLNDIADSTADGSIAQAGYKLTLTSTLNSAGAIWTFTNTTADLTADVSFIDLKLTDDADANGFFMRGYDNAGNDLKWSVGADGAITTTGTITAPSFASNAADGAHYVEAINTVDLSSTATAGRIAYGPVSGDATSRHRIADGTDWNNYLVDKEAIDSAAELETLVGGGAFMSDLLGYATAANVASGIGVGTEDSPQFTAVEVGAASDTTLARVGAGQVSVEGVNVVTTSSTDTLTNKTIDANGTGNVLKGYGYITLSAPHIFGAGVTQQTTATARVYGQALFANATDQATNFVEYTLEVPRDLDTSVDLVGYFKFNLGGADTGDHDYVISMIDIADSADNATAVGDAVNLAFTADASGASGDIETATGTLTGWAAALTPGSKLIIRVARDGDAAADASTVDSYSGPLTIRYGFTQ